MNDYYTQKNHWNGYDDGTKYIGKSFLAFILIRRERVSWNIQKIYIRGMQIPLMFFYFFDGTWYFQEKRQTLRYSHDEKPLVERLNF